MGASQSIAPLVSLSGDILVLGTTVDATEPTTLVINVFFLPQTLYRFSHWSAMSEATLSSPLSLRGRTSWFGEIELHDEKIVISGWGWDGPFREEIPIQKITAFETWSHRGGTNFRLRIENRASVRGKIKKGLGLWQTKLETDERIHFKRRH